MIFLFGFHLHEPRYLPRPLVSCQWERESPNHLRGRHLWKARSKRCYPYLGVFPCNTVLKYLLFFHSRVTCPHWGSSPHGVYTNVDIAPSMSWYCVWPLPHTFFCEGGLLHTDVRFKCVLRVRHTTNSKDKNHREKITCVNPGMCHGPLSPAYGKESHQIILRGRYFAGSKRFHSSLGVLPSNSEATLWQRGSDWFLWDSCAIASSVFRFSIGVGEFKCVRTCIRRVVNRGVWCVGWLTALRRCTKRMVSLTSRFAHSVFSDSSLSTFSNRDSRFNAATRCKPSRDFFPLGGHQCRNKSGFSVKFKWCRI